MASCTDLSLILKHALGVCNTICPEAPIPIQLRSKEGNFSKLHSRSEDAMRCVNHLSVVGVTHCMKLDLALLAALCQNSSLSPAQCTLPSQH